MSDQTGKPQWATWKNLLQVDNSNTGLDATYRDIESWDGTASGAQLSTAGLKIPSGKTLVVASGATFTLDGALNFGDEDLDAYDEGTWTPTLGTTGTDFDSVTYDAVTWGQYTRIGNLCFISGRLLTDAITVGSASGIVVIEGLPFTVDGGQANGVAAVISVGTVGAWAGDMPLVGQAVDGTTLIYLYYRSAVNGTTLEMQVSDVDTGTNDNNIAFSGFYRIA